MEMRNWKSVNHSQQQQRENQDSSKQQTDYLLDTDINDDSIHKKKELNDSVLRSMFAKI